MLLVPCLHHPSRRFGCGAQDRGQALTPEVAPSLLPCLCPAVALNQAITLSQPWSVLIPPSDPGSPHCAWFPKYLYRQPKPLHWYELYMDSSPLMLTLEFHRVWLGYPFTQLFINSVPNLLKRNDENKFCYQEKDNTNKPVQNRQTEDLTWKIYGLPPAVSLREAQVQNVVVKNFHYK